MEADISSEQVLEGRLCYSGTSELIFWGGKRGRLKATAEKAAVLHNARYQAFNREFIEIPRESIHHSFMASLTGPLESHETLIDMSAVNDTESLRSYFKMKKYLMRMSWHQRR